MNRREFLTGCAGTMLLTAGRGAAQSSASETNWLAGETAGQPINLARCGEIKSWISPEAFAAFRPAQGQFRNVLNLGALPWKESEVDVGVEWPEFRTVTAAFVQFSGNPPDPSEVYLEYWNGLTTLQGSWQGFEHGTTNGTHLEIDRGKWTFRFASHRTCKVRLRFRGGHNAAIEQVAIHGPSVYKMGEIRLEWGHGATAPWKGRLEAYNAEIVEVRALDGAKTDGRHGWTSSQGSPAGVSISLLYASGLDVDRSVLTVRTDNGGFSFLPAEAIDEGAIDVPDFGAYIRRSDFEAGWNAYRNQNRGKQRVIDAVGGLSEQTLEGAYAHIQARRVTLTFVGAEANNQKFGIAPDGHFVIGNNDPLAGDAIVPSFAIYFDSAEQPFLLEHPGEPANIFPRHEPNVTTVEPKEQALEDGWLPIVTTKWSQNELAFQRTDLGALASGDQASEKRMGNEPAILASELRIRNSSPVPKLASYYIRPWKPAGNTRFTYGPLPMEAPEAWTTVLRGDLIAVLDGEKESVVCRMDLHGGGKLALEPKYNAVRYQVRLNPGEERRVHMFVAGWLPVVGDESQLRGAEYARLHHAVAEHWIMLRDQSMRIEIPDRHLQNIFDASLHHFLLVLTKNGNKGEYSPNTAMLYYGSIGSESNPVIRALDMRGLPDFAAGSLQAFLSTQGEFMPEGDYLSKEGGFYRFWPLYTIDQGGVLWALAEHYFVTRDADWLRRVAPQMVAGCDFIIRARARMKKLNPDGTKPLHYGFAPAGCAADPRDWQYSFILNSWFYAGLRRASLALQDIDAENARRIAADADDYQHCILTALKESLVRSPVTRLRDNSSVPSLSPYLGPRGFSTELKDSVDPDLRHGYAYDCTIGPFHLFNCGVLEPNDPVVSWMLNYLEDRFFLFTPLPSRVNLDNIATDWFNLGGFEKLQPYYVHYQEAYLRRDQIPNFLRGFFNTLAAISDPDTLTFQEELDFGGGQPHKTHEEGWFFEQIRSMLVIESGEELHLAAGTPRKWLEDGQRISIRNAPTYFGKVGYEIVSAIKAGKIHGSVQSPRRNPPSRVLLRLRHPSRQQLKRVTVNGKNWEQLDREKEWIVLPAAGDNIDFVAYY